MAVISTILKPTRSWAQLVQKGYMVYQKLTGHRLILFCERMELKIMDTFFPRQHGDYGTWKCNRSVDKGYSAALDHTLVINVWWYEVKVCGVIDDQFSVLRTDHKLIEMELFSKRANDQAHSIKEKPRQKVRTEQEIKQTNRNRFGKLMLHYRSHESEENGIELRKVKANYEVAIKSEMLKYGQQKLTAVDVISIMEKARDAIIDRNWPEGVPAIPKDKPSFWYENADQRVSALVKKKRYLMQKWLNFQRIAPSPRTLEICLRDMKQTQQKLRSF